MNRIVSLFIAAWFGLLLVTGCAHKNAITFKTVDSVTGRPLAGVSTVWCMRSRDYFYITRYNSGLIDLHPSSEDGIVLVDGIYKNKGSQFVFSRIGYAPVYGIYSYGSMTRADHIYTNHYDYPFDEKTYGFMIKAPLSDVLSSNGVFVIQMSQK